MKYLLAGGGTGGHLFPLLATAAELVKIDAAAEILFAGSPRGNEEELVRRAGFEFVPLAFGALAGGSLLSRLKTALSLPLYLAQSYALLRRFNPACVFGLGGYIAGPVLLAAKLRATPSAILEPNAVAGLANLLLGLLADKVFIAFPEAGREFPPGKVIQSGNPLRPEIAAAALRPRPEKPFTVLIFGGSQGAGRLNQAISGALPLLGDLKGDLYFIHQTGKRDLSWVQEVYRRHDFPGEVKPFIDEMGEAYARAHLVLSRSGSSVLEIAAAGRPSLLVPYPHAARDHQRHNAEHLVRAGAAQLIPDAEAHAGRVAAAVRQLYQDRATLQRMGQATAAIARPQAAREVAQTLFALAGGTPC